MWTDNVTLYAACTLAFVFLFFTSAQSQGSSGKLGFEEARARSELVKNVRYEAALDLTGSSEEFRTETKVTFDARTQGASTFIDIAAKRVECARLNGVSIPAAAFSDARLAIGPLKERNELRVVAVFPYEQTGVGLHRFVDPTDGNVYLHTQFEPFDAHRVYACFDQPDIKATFVFRVRAPKGWRVVSNQSALQTAPEGQEGQEWADWSFEPTPLISTYVTALIAGPYAEVRSEHKGLPLALYARRSLEAYLDSEEIFAITKSGLDFFGERFGILYPFSKYDQAFVPEFSAGAMENAGLVTFNERYLFRSKVSEASKEGRANTILHEMAHMWFGDLVTMRWWDDLWLNESFADFMASYALKGATRFQNAWAHFANTEKAQALLQDQMSTTHPIVAHYPDTESVRLGFDAITYQKGASVLKQLMAYVEEEAFFSGLKRYLQTHALGNAEFADFLAALEQSSGRDLKGWARAWLQTSGVNTITPVVAFQSDKIGSVTLRQDAPADHQTLRPHRLGVGLYAKVGERMVRSHGLIKDIEGKSTPIPELASEQTPEILLPNDEDLTYAKIRLDPKSSKAAEKSLGLVEDPLARVLLWGYFWDMTRDAEYPASSWLKLFYGHVRSEPDPMVLDVLLARSEDALLRFTAVARQKESWAGFARFAKERMGLSQPGSDQQLSWAKAFFDTAYEKDQLSFLKGLLDGTEQIPGLTMDVDRRWQTILTLAKRGETTKKAIQGELERDPTDMGQRNAARARASLPTPEAKALAWKEATQNPDIPLKTREALALGFWQPFQEDVLAPYATRYFEEVQSFWQRFGPDEAIVLTSRLFPRLFVKEDVLIAAERLLQDSKLSYEARRILMEGKDEIQRALKAMACDERAS